MNAEIITRTAIATLNGTVSFPEVVSRLLAAGVEFYHVDYVGMRKTFYSASGEIAVTPINYEGLPPVAADFDATALRANILDSQRNGRACPRRLYTPRHGGGRARLLRLPARQARHLLWSPRRPTHGMVPGCWAEARAELVALFTAGLVSQPRPVWPTASVIPASPYGTPRRE